jgi:DNA-binding NtrC family response regulator
VLWGRAAHQNGALVGENSNANETARALGIGRRTLYRLLEEYRIVDTETEGQLTTKH